jgi:hypothetical protein
MSDLVEKGFTLKNLDTGKRTTQHHLDLYYENICPVDFFASKFLNLDHHTIPKSPETAPLRGRG